MTGQFSAKSTNRRIATVSEIFGFWRFPQALRHCYGLARTIPRLANFLESDRGGFCGRRTYDDPFITCARQPTASARFHLDFDCIVNGNKETPWPHLSFAPPSWRCRRRDRSHRAHAQPEAGPEGIAAPQPAQPAPAVCRPPRTANRCCSTISNASAAKPICGGPQRSLSQRRGFGPRETIHTK
jgi:hypothetical protein